MKEVKFMLTPHTLISSNIDVLYQKIIEEIKIDGTDCTARGLEFRELLFSHLILTNPRARIIQNPRRKISKKFMIAEFIWIMTGENSVDMISKYNKNMAQFSDDGEILYGAYGPRLRNWNGYDQIKGCLKRLQKDSGTRQAVIVILDPARDFLVETKDIPCNDLLQFFIRENKLHMATYVRSNDVLLGIPYDIFHWTILQELFANILDVELGEYHHFVGSLHIYKKDFEKLYSCLNFEIPHIDMEKMPKEEDLSILDRLKLYFFYKNRNTIDLTLLPNSYWKSFVGALNETNIN